MPDFNCSVITAILVEFTTQAGKITSGALVIFLLEHRIRIFRKQFVSYIYDSICYRFFAI